MRKFRLCQRRLCCLGVHFHNGVPAILRCVQLVSRHAAVSHAAEFLEQRAHFILSRQGAPGRLSPFIIHHSEHGSGSRFEAPVGALPKRMPIHFLAARSNVIILKWFYYHKM
jgi:hypothetical protein